MKKKQKIRGGINTLCTTCGIRILKIKDEIQGIYFCWEKCTKINDDIECFVIKCKSDIKVIDFCEQNNLKNLRDALHNQSLKDLSIITYLITENEKSLLKIIIAVMGNIKREKLDIVPQDTPQVFPNIVVTLRRPKKL